jgi:hypothetical protein
MYLHGFLFSVNKAADRRVKSGAIIDKSGLGVKSRRESPQGNRM